MSTLPLVIGFTVPLERYEAKSSEDGITEYENKINLLIKYKVAFKQFHNILLLQS
jgi:hypothetical protein